MAKMFATCDSDTGVALKLNKGEEYRILKVETIDGFADVFYLLEDGLLYASCHFSVTYTK